MPETLRRIRESSEATARGTLRLPASPVLRGPWAPLTLVVHAAPSALVALAALVALVTMTSLTALPARANPIVKGRLSRSDTCGACHKDIYKMWKSSVHADAMEDMIFQDAYATVQSRDAAVAKDCLACHAPSVAVNGDALLDQRVTWEGVTCDICHSMTGVDLTGRAPRLTLDVGTVKRGPIKDAESMAHKVAYSEFHKSALVCAGCHEYANRDGTPIITTYSEWKDSAMPKEAKTCQVCHMGRVQASAVDPRIKRVSGVAVNLHEMPGGHSLQQLNRALDMSVQPKRENGSLNLRIVLKNKGAGHAVPTGMPGRRVILELSVETSDGKSYQEQRTYSKQYVDGQGAPITRDEDYFFKGVKLVADSRLKPGEQRVESFQFAVAPKATAFLTIKLHYEHAPTGGTENRTWITFQSEKRTLLPEGTHAG